MLSPLLTIIISYNPKIPDINKEYHNTFIYREKPYIALFHKGTMYNWRCKKISDISIYDKYALITGSLPKNY